MPFKSLDCHKYVSNWPETGNQADVPFEILELLELDISGPSEEFSFPKIINLQGMATALQIDPHTKVIPRFRRACVFKIDVGVKASVTINLLPPLELVSIVPGIGHTAKVPEENEAMWTCRGT